MKKKLLVPVLALGTSLVSAEAYADSRVVDGLLGAGAGALVAGPVGLVAGGVIGFSAGPNISCGMRGCCGHRRHYYRHQAAATAPRN